MWSCCIPPRKCWNENFANCLIYVWFWLKVDSTSCKLLNCKIQLKSIIYSLPTTPHQKQTVPSRAQYLWSTPLSPIEALHLSSDTILMNSVGEQARTKLRPPGGEVAVLSTDLSSNAPLAEWLTSGLSGFPEYSNEYILPAKPFFVWILLLLW